MALKLANDTNVTNKAWYEINPKCFIDHVQLIESYLLFSKSISMGLKRQLNATVARKQQHAAYEWHKMSKKKFLIFFLLF